MSEVFSLYTVTYRTAITIEGDYNSRHMTARRRHCALTDTLRHAHFTTRARQSAASGSLRAPLLRARLLARSSLGVALAERRLQVADFNIQQTGIEGDRMSASDVSSVPIVTNQSHPSSQIRACPDPEPSAAPSRARRASATSTSAAPTSKRSRRAAKKE